MARRDLLSALAIAVLAVVAHAPALGGGFVFDDHRFIEQNPALEHVDPVAYLLDPTTASATDGIHPDVYRPVRTLDFAVGRAVLGEHTFLWHLESVLWHALAAVLVLRLLRPLLPGAPMAALAGAALFAVHPVTTESVAWISSRGDLMAVALMLTVLLVAERPGPGRTALGAALLALALLAKESALVLPALLPLRDLALPRGVRPPVRTTLTRTALLGAVVAGYLVLRLQLLPGLGQVEDWPGGSRAAAARGMLAGLAWYAKALAWPTGFAFEEQLPVPLSWAEPAVVIGAGLLATVVLAGLLGVRRRTLLAFAALGALAALVPVSNVLVPLKTLVAERFLYPVLVPVVAGIAYGLLRLQRRTVPAVPLVLGAVAVAALLPATWERGRAWHDDLTLWEAVLHDRADELRAYEGIAWEYQERGRIRDAEIAWRSYLEFNPADGKGHRRLGDVYGSVADSLRIEEVRPDVATDVAMRRREARIQQLAAYARALSVWETLGLVAGRGSPALRRETWERVYAAAFDLGDLAKARQANDALLALDGVDPRDPDAVRTSASPARRLARLDLALRAVLVPSRSLPEAQRAEADAQRAAVLRDVGVDPALDDRRALAALRPQAEGLASGPGGSVAAGLKVALIAMELGDLDGAEAVLTGLLGRAPDDPAVRRGLEELRRRRRGG